MTLPSWSTACLDWESRIADRRSLVTFDPLFPHEADAALDVFRDLTLVDVAGRPTMGQACLPWAFDLPRALFGSYDSSTGRQLIRTFFEFVAKKNSKSTRAAGIMLTALTRNWRDSGEYYILAPTKEVADNSFKPAWDMVKASGELSDLLHVRPDHKTITHRNTGAFLKVVAADSGTVAGKKTIGLLVDELWLFGGMAHAEAMLREVAGGLLSRPEGFVIYLSTQSDSSPDGVFKQQLDKFRSIRDGKITDNSSLPLLYEFPERMLKDGSYRERKNWYIPNPNLGRSVDEDEIAKLLNEAEQSGKASLVNAEAKFLNVEVGIGSFEWRAADYWQDAADTTLTLETLLERSEVVTFGADGGGRDDLFGIAVMGREKITRHWLLWNHAFVHVKALEVRKAIAPRLLDFERDRSLTICKSSRAIISGMGDVFAKVLASGKLPKKFAVALDPNNVAAMIEELVARGMTEDMLKRLLQGKALTPAWHGIEMKLDDLTLHHAGQPMMAWCVGNAKVTLRGNEIYIEKAVAGRAKIDPLIATAQATILMSWNPAARMGYVMGKAAVA